jgi:chemotaxis protein CheC
MHLSPEHVDALQELFNIGIGRSAGSLNHMLGAPIRLYIPSIRAGNRIELINELCFKNESVVSSILLPFQGSFAGSACLFFPTNSAAALVAALTGEHNDQHHLNSLKDATLTEIGNIVLNGVMGSLSNVLQHQIFFLVPYYRESTLQEIIQATSSDSSEVVLWAQTRFTIEEHDISGNIMLMLGVPDIGILLNAIDTLTYPA